MAVRKFGNPANPTHVILARFNGKVDYLRSYLNPDEPAYVERHPETRPRVLHLTAAEASHANTLLRHLGSGRSTAPLTREPALAAYDYLAANNPSVLLAIRAQGCFSNKRRARYRSLFDAHFAATHPTPDSTTPALQ